MAGPPVPAVDPSHGERWQGPAIVSGLHLPAGHRGGGVAGLEEVWFGRYGEELEHVEDASVVGAPSASSQAASSPPSERGLALSPAGSDWDTAAPSDSEGGGGGGDVAAAWGQPPPADGADFLRSQRAALRDGATTLERASDAECWMRLHMQLGGLASAQARTVQAGRRLAHEAAGEEWRPSYGIDGPATLQILAEDSDTACWDLLRSQLDNARQGVLELAEKLEPERDQVELAEVGSLLRLQLRELTLDAHTMPVRGQEQLDERLQELSECVKAVHARALQGPMLHDLAMEAPSPRREPGLSRFGQAAVAAAGP